MDWKMLSTDDGNRIRGSYGDAVVVDPAEPHRPVESRLFRADARAPMRWPSAMPIVMATRCRFSLLIGPDMGNEQVTLGTARCMPTSRPFPSEALSPFGMGKARAPPKVSPSRKSSTTLLGLSGLTLAMAFIPHDFIGSSYRHTVICNGN